MNRVHLLKVRPEDDADTLARNIDKAVIAVGGTPASAEQLTRLKERIKQRIPQLSRTDSKAK